MKRTVRLVKRFEDAKVKEEPFPIGCDVITTGPEKFDRVPLRTLGKVTCHAIGCYGVQIQVSPRKTKTMWYDKKNLQRVKYEQ